MEFDHAPQPPKDDALSPELRAWIEVNRGAIEEMRTHEDEVFRAYADAYSEGCFVREFSLPAGMKSDGMTAVGDMQRILDLEKETGADIDISELGISDLVNLAHPGDGETRAERILDGIRQVHEARERKRDPDALDHYGTIEENGYRVAAFMPANAGQDLQWTIRVSRIDDESLIRTETVPMIYEPIFGVDIDDIAALEERTEAILAELLEK